MRLLDSFRKMQVTTATEPPVGDAAAKLSDGFMIVTVGQGKATHHEWQYLQNWNIVSGLAVLDQKMDCIFLSPWKQAHELPRVELAAWKSTFDSLRFWSGTRWCWRHHSITRGVLYERGQIACPESSAVIAWMGRYLSERSAEF